MINRALRSLITVRRRLNSTILTRLINYYFVGQNFAKQKSELLSYFKIFPSMETTTETILVPKSPRQQRKVGAGASANVGLLPEVETYLHLLVVLYLMNEKRYAEVSFFQIRLRMATLRHDEDCQATLINCLLRAYLLQNNYELASALIPKVNFPLSGSTNQWARYHYYVGKIKAKELQYAEAKQSLQLALRKAPQHTAIGFKQSAQKLLVTVELLMGQIPDRSLFREGIYRKSLAPYLQLAQAVRVGDVERFDSTLKKFSVQFENDETNDLVVRLRQNVIKTAVRQICLAYSRISLADVQKKLRLTQTQDAEYILAKVE
uniref:PCI domain-containing protein n=1 Tax=Romanomermis culicivorax TaxID=13658 RepID=A0A915J6R6_ROMCU